MALNSLPEELIQQIYSQLPQHDRTNLRSCNKKFASTCPAIPPNTFLRGFVPPMLRDDNDECTEYDTITLSKLTRYIDESPQLAIYRNAPSYHIGIYLVYNNIKKIASIIGPCIHFILYKYNSYNQLICNWKYCNEFINATNSGFSNFETVIAMFLCSIFYSEVNFK